MKKFKLCFLAALLFSTISESAVPEYAEQLSVDLFIGTDNTYDELIQRTKIRRRPSDVTEIRRIFTSQNEAVAINRFMIVHRADFGLPKIQVVFSSPSEANGNAALQQLERALASTVDGDRFIYEVKIHHGRKLPELQQSLRYYLRRSEVFGDGRVRVHVPATGLWKVVGAGFDIQSETENNGKKTYSYQIRNDNELPLEAESANEAITSPHVVASTFQNYSDLAKTISREFESASIEDPAVNLLAKKLGTGQRGQRAIAQNIYRWVQENIAYDDQNTYANGITPYRASEVLMKRRGDCKDHVVLFAALLRARGIASEAALITTESNYELSELPIIEDFNHVITYIPSLQLYADPTDKHAQFGTLPWNREVKPILFLTTPERLGRTPNFGPSSSETIAKYLMYENGSMEVHSRTLSKGAAASETRLVRNAMEGRDLDTALNSALIAKGFLSPRATMSFGKDEPMVFNMDFLVVLPNPDTKTRSLSLNPFFHSSHTLVNQVRNFSAAQRRSSFICNGKSITENYSISFPAGTKFAMLPNPTSFFDSNLSYFSSYEQLENKIKITRSFVNKNLFPVCKASDYSRYRELAHSISTDLAKQIAYTLP